MNRNIQIRGAREHNLVNVNLELPRNKLICFTGVSGSGKSSLAFDTLYAEGQRRYVESLSSFARQFLGQAPKPDVDLISGLSPAISIAQKTAGSNPRSTVGTITEIYDFLRVLYARIGVGHCPVCGKSYPAYPGNRVNGSNCPDCAHIIIGKKNSKKISPPRRIISEGSSRISLKTCGGRGTPGFGLTARFDSFRKTFVLTDR